MDGTKTRTSGGKTLSSGGTAPLKPKPGLSGPPVPSVIAAMNRCATQNQAQHRAGAQKTNPTLALGMRKDGALRRLAGLMNLVATNSGVVYLLVLTGFVPQGQFDSVPQS